MTLHNEFKKAADDLRISPSARSWSQLETKLDNRELVQKNNSYRIKLRYLTGIAAGFVLLAMAVLYTQNTTVENKLLCCSLEYLSYERPNGIYDLEKLEILDEQYIQSKDLASDKLKRF